METINSEATRVIDALGGTFAVARLCNVKPPSVSEWKKNGIPDARLQFLQLLRPDLFGPASAKKRPPSHDQSEAA